MNGQLSKQVIIKGTFFTKDLMIKNKVNFKSLIIEDLKIKKKQTWIKGSIKSYLNIYKLYIEGSIKLR